MSGANVRVTADNVELSIVFDTFLNQCADENVDKLIKNIDAASSEAVSELKRTSPRGVTKKRPYRLGWTKKRQRIDHGLGGVFVVVYNKNKPTLTYLLEHGHRVVRGGSLLSGGHVVGHAKAYPHIDKAKEHALSRILGGA